MALFIKNKKNSNQCFIFEKAGTRFLKNTIKYMSNAKKLITQEIRKTERIVLFRCL